MVGVESGVQDRDKDRTLGLYLAPVTEVENMDLSLSLYLLSPLGCMFCILEKPFKVFLKLCIMPQHACRSQNNFQESVFFPSMWVPSLEHRLSVLVASILTP